MNIKHLKYVIEVEKTGSISQAANNLFMGQLRAITPKVMERLLSCCYYDTEVDF
jgi:hypothetical protein